VSQRAFNASDAEASNTSHRTGDFHDTARCRVISFALGVPLLRRQRQHGVVCVVQQSDVVVGHAAGARVVLREAARLGGVLLEVAAQNRRVLGRALKQLHAYEWREVCVCGV
jgi:hypothetical protein